MKKMNQTNKRERSYKENLIWIFMIALVILAAEASDSKFLSLAIVIVAFIVGVILAIRGIIIFIKDKRN